MGERPEQRKREDEQVCVSVFVLHVCAQVQRRNFQKRILQSPLNIDVPLLHATLCFYLSLSLCTAPLKVLSIY